MRWLLAKDLRLLARWPLLVAMLVIYPIVHAALAKKFTQVANGYIQLLSTGGSFEFLGRAFDVLGLVKTEKILAQVAAGLPSDSPAAPQLAQVLEFARVARQNL